MSSTVSKALWVWADVGAVVARSAPATGPATRAADDAKGALVLQTVAAVGLCVLVVWIVRRLANPRKLTLRDSPGRPNSLNPLHVLGVLFVWALASLGLAKGLAIVFGAESMKTMALTAAGASAVLGGASLGVAGFTFPLGIRRGLGLSLRRWMYDTGRGVVGYLAVFPVCWALLLATVALISPEQVHEHQLLTGMAELGGLWRVLMVLSAVVLAPVAEELFFRGLVQSMLRRYLGSPWAAILGASVLFALVHASNPHTMPALLPLGVVMGYNYERCGRLYPAILIHAVFNAVFVGVHLTNLG